MRLIGMVHLPPLPGSPRWDGSMEKTIAAALADARALVDNGMDAIIVENYGDAPFTPGRVAAATVAAMSVIAHEIRRALPETPLGVNVLKSDPRSALAVATAVGARFIRVNVLAGAVVADQGIVQTDAYDLLRDRRLLGVEVAIFADVQGKHAVPLAPVELEQQARDLASRSLADGLVVSGRATGDATPIDDVKRVRSAVPDVPILVGSGVTPETAADLLSLADALIVGTSLKRDGDVSKPVDPERVRRLVDAVGGRRSRADRARGPAHRRHAAGGRHQLEPRARGRRRLQPGQPGHRRRGPLVRRQPPDRGRAGARVHHRDARGGRADRAQALPGTRLEHRRLARGLRGRHRDRAARRRARALPATAGRGPRRRRHDGARLQSPPRSLGAGHAVAVDHRRDAAWRAGLARRRRERRHA